MGFIPNISINKLEYVFVNTPLPELNICPIQITSSISFSTASNINAPPSISGNSATILSEGSSYTFTPIANDADGNTLSLNIDYPEHNFERNIIERNPCDLIDKKMIKKNGE